MLSYRHAFHAGNHADVLKHIVLLECLQYLQKKDKGLSYIDTHAGAGLYSLQSAQANRVGEYRQGIGKLMDSPLPGLQAYLNLIRQFNPGGTLKFYPGSPLLAAQLLRPQDQGWLFELHSSDYPLLQKHCDAHRQLRVRQEDGFSGLPGLLPPTTRRGLVLIDPSYEIKTDYQKVVDALSQAYRRFATGTYLLWYPVVQRRQIQRLEQQLKQTGIRHMHLFELGVEADTEGHGMTASGMVVINPPWTLVGNLETLLPALAQQLAPATGTYRSECLQAQ